MTSSLFVSPLQLEVFHAPSVYLVSVNPTTFREEPFFANMFYLVSNKRIHDYVMSSFKKKILLDMLTSEDWLNLERLTTATLDEIPIQGMRDDLLPYMAMSVGKLKFAIGLFQDSKEKDTYSIRHIQDCDDILFQPEDSDRVSFFPICAVLQKEDYKELSNIKFDRILPSLKSYTERSENYNVVNEIMLRIIAASDISSGARKAILLKTAMEIAEWLLSLPSDIWEKRIAVINKLQITARQRELSDEERGVLYAMIAISNDRRDILFAANALLGKREDAHQHFMLLPKAVQAELCNYPIYRFL